MNYRDQDILIQLHSLCRSTLTQRANAIMDLYLSGHDVSGIRKETGLSYNIVDREIRNSQYLMLRAMKGAFEMSKGQMQVDWRSIKMKTKLHVQLASNIGDDLNELQYLTRESVMKWRGMGQTTMNELERIMQEHGIQWERWLKMMDLGTLRRF